MHLKATLPTFERPRERALRRGVAHLSDGELVALVLGRGTRTLDVVSCGRALLDAVGGVQALREATPAELCSHTGIGPAQALRLLAAVELGLRALMPREARPRIRSPGELYEHMRPRLTPLSQEVFVAVPLDARHRPLAEIVVAQGTVSSCEVHPREAFRGLIRHAAAAAFFAHNHPSGDPEPSNDDITLTRRLREVGHLVGIPVLAHIIVGHNAYVSLAERGLL